MMPDAQMSCQHDDTSDQSYSLFTADPKTRLYRSEKLRYESLLRLIPGGIRQVLDIGCGTGYLSIRLAEAGLDVTALDLQAERLQVFAEQAHRLGIEQRAEDIFQTDLLEIELIVAQEIIEHLPDVAAALMRFQQLLMPGGRLVISVPYRENLQAKQIQCPVCGQMYHRNGHLHSFDEHTLQELVIGAGLRVEQMHLLVNKRGLKWFSRVSVDHRVGPLLWLDHKMNALFPHKASYLALVARK